VQSILLTPLLVSDEVIGIINLYTIHTPRQFTAEEIELAQTMANQVAVVIKNLQSQEEVSAVQTVNSAFMLLSRWAHKVRQKSFALRKDLDSLKKDLPMGLFDDMLDRMSESIQELSLPTQILAGGAEDSPEQLVDLAQLLREVATRLCGRHRTVPIELALKIDDVPRAIKGNQLFLEIALEMLIENAVESIEQKGEPGLLEARCYLLNDTVTAQIRDSGSGIPTEIEENLFRGRVTSKKGFGYGSFTAANILRAHKGDIQVVETGPAGTVIEFYLPASQTGGKHNE
jgi:signal transduction histidine kinase